MDDSLSRLRGLIQALPSGLQNHLYRTRDAALALASLHHLDANKVEIAALGHDLLRATTDEELLREARTLGLALHPVEERVPVLLHGPMAAQRLRQNGIIVDPEVLEAIHWHSTACPGLGKVGLVVFLADKLDPQKVARTPRFKGLAVLAQESLEKAVAEYLTWELTVLLQQGSLLHPASVEARNYFMSQAQPPVFDAS